ncbi:hypothetical protein [Microbacterium sp.]|uniref:hypothetical protein n=1 Tax=Microbacterium sp. TaxID=51671 RepID=UPI0025DD908D|nr:hypothetical protein [Microbacterium sp.]
MAEDTQDEPVLEQNTASEQERLDGLVAQMRADVQGEDAATVEQALRHRLTDIGMTLDESEIAQLVADLTAP